MQGLQEKITSLETQLKAAVAATEQLQQQLASHRLFQSAAVTAHEQALREVKGQLEAKQSEVRRLQAEATSRVKQYEQAVLRLQREADAGAAEIARLRQMKAAKGGEVAGGNGSSSSRILQGAGVGVAEGGEGQPGGYQQQLEQKQLRNELSQLKRWVQGKPGGGGACRSCWRSIC